MHENKKGNQISHTFFLLSILFELKSNSFHVFPHYFFKTFSPKIRFRCPLPNKFFTPKLFLFQFLLYSEH